MFIYKEYLFKDFQFMDKKYSDKILKFTVKKVFFKNTRSTADFRRILIIFKKKKKMYISINFDLIFFFWKFKMSILQNIILFCNFDFDTWSSSLSIYYKNQKFNLLYPRTLSSRWPIITIFNSNISLKYGVLKSKSIVDASFRFIA